MNMEHNKILAAILVAGIIASLGGFVSEQLIHPHQLEEPAYKIEGVESAASGGIKQPQLPEPVLHMIADADLAAGQKLSRACAACHSFEKGGANGVGPNLWNVVMQDKGARSDFSYSDAMKEKGGKWDYLALNKFLWKPKKYIEGTKMNYIGLRDPEDRAAMIAWLRTLSDSAPPLPTAAQIEAEQVELLPKPEEEPSPGEETGTAGETQL